jgi:hypothetical protein
VINLSNISLINPFREVSLLTLISAIFGQILSLIADRVLVIYLSQQASFDFCCGSLPLVSQHLLLEHQKS